MTAMSARLRTPGHTSTIGEERQCRSTARDNSRALHHEHVGKPSTSIRQCHNPSLAWTLRGSTTLTLWLARESGIRSRCLCRARPALLVETDEVSEEATKLVT